ADPKVAVGCVGQRAHRVLRQSLLALPDSESERQRPAAGAPRRAARGDEVAERSRDGHVAERPPPTATAVADVNLVERGIGGEAGGYLRRLTFLGGTGREVGIEPGRYPVIAASDILHLEHDGDFDAAPGQLVRQKDPWA